MSDFDDIMFDDTNFDDEMKKPDYKETCEAHAFQEASVCVPVEVIPFAKAGHVKTFCKGKPIITSGCIECPGSINNKCHFTITQKICVKVPVEFGANTVVGSPHVKCERPSGHDCKDCDIDE